MATSAQKIAVVLAFVAAGLSFGVVAVGFSRTGRVDLTPLAGGLFMLALGVSGVLKIRPPRP